MFLPTDRVGGWRRTVAVGLLSAVLVTAGCQPEPADPGIPGTPSPTPSVVEREWMPPAPSLSYEEAVALVPVEGTELVPLYWETPELADPELVEAMEVARRFIAMEYYEWSLVDPVPVIHLYRYLITEEFFDFLFPPDPEQEVVPYTRLEPNEDVGVGPVWVHIKEVNRLSTNRIQVDICRNGAWWAPKSRQKFNPRTDPGAAIWYEVVRGEVDGEPRWLVRWVHFYGANTQVAKECDGWATHTPAPGDLP